MTASKRVTTAINAAIHQIGWFACVLGAAWGWGTAGATVALLLTGLHLLLTENPDRELPVLVVAGILGITLDSLHAGVGILRFEGHAPGTIAPVWIVALWVQFGTVLHFCMSWLSRRYLLAALLGLVGGPMSFLAGERLGAASFGEPRMASLALLALSWALALPFMVAVADRFTTTSDRYRSPFESAQPGRPMPVRVPVRSPSGR